MPDKITVKVARQNWRAWRYSTGPRWTSVRLERGEPDRRPFRCSDAGKPEPRRIGRTKLIVRLSHRTRRVMLDDESAGTFDKDARRALSKVLAPLIPYP